MIRSKGLIRGRRTPLEVAGIGQAGNGSLTGGDDTVHKWDAE